MYRRSSRVPTLRRRTAPAAAAARSSPRFSPPPGYQAPPPGYQAPPPGTKRPGYQPPPPGYQAPPPGYQRRPRATSTAARLPDASPPGYQGQQAAGGFRFADARRPPEKLRRRIAQRAASPACSRSRRCPPSSRSPTGSGSSAASGPPGRSHRPVRVLCPHRFRAAPRAPGAGAGVGGPRAGHRPDHSGHEDEGRPGMGPARPDHCCRHLPAAGHHQCQRCRGPDRRKLPGFIISLVATVLMWLPNPQAWFAAHRGRV